MRESHRTFYASNTFTDRVVGVTSVVGGVNLKRGREAPGHVPLIDYDGKDSGFMRSMLRYAQYEWGWGTAWVFESRRGYHIWTADIIPKFRDYCWQLARLPCESKEHAVMSAESGFATLRLTPKGHGDVGLRFAEMIPRVGRYPLSSAHGEFMRKYFGLPVELTTGMAGEWDTQAKYPKRVMVLPYRTPSKQRL